MDKKISGVIIACQKVEVDEQTGFISAHKIIPALQVVVSAEERASVGKKPRGIKAPMDVIVMLDKLESAIGKDLVFDCALEFIGPHGEVTMDHMRSHVVFPAATDRHYVFFKFDQGIVASFPGKHFFRAVSMQPEVTGTELLGEVTFMINMFDADGTLITA